MKHFSMTNPIVKFPVICPQDKKEHETLAHALCKPNEPPLLTFVECHGSCDCNTCKHCLHCITQMFIEDAEPELFLDPLDPEILPYWKDI